MSKEEAIKIINELLRIDRLTDWEEEKLEALMEHVKKLNGNNV